MPNTPSPLNILLADDNQANCLIALTILERSGHSVTTVRTGDHALRLTKLAAYDLIILDLLMPVMDGLQALHRIRLESPLNQSALIFAFNTFSDAEDWQQYRAAGFDAALAKPLRSGDLESALAGLETRNRAPARPSADSYSLEHIPLLDEDMIYLLTKHGTPESLKQIQSRLWSSIHPECMTIVKSLPRTLEGNDISLSKFRNAVHSVKSTCDSIGLMRLAHISRRLQNSPVSEIRGRMDAFLNAISESRPALEHALSGARQLNTAVQMRRQDQPETAHNG